MGPAVALPTIHGPPLVGIPTEGVLVARGVGAGVGRGVGCRAGVGGAVGAGVGLACASALGAGWALAIGPLATGIASPVSLTLEATPSDVTAYTHVWREMQPAGQSPQPSWTVTLQPDAAGTTSYHEPWPTMPGSRGPIPAKRASSATTIAAASDAVIALAGAVGVTAGVDVGAPGLPAAGALHAASRSATMSMLANAAGRDGTRMAR
jgi:hypothetical protein